MKTKLSDSLFAELRALLTTQGRDDENDSIYEKLHRSAECALDVLLRDRGIDPLSVDEDEIAELQIAYKEGFWSLCWEGEREQGRKALDVLGRLHDWLSERVEAGGTFCDADHIWLSHLLTVESLPLVGEGERVKPADVSGAAVGAPDVVGEGLADLKTARVPDWHEVRKVLVLSTGHLEGQTFLDYEGAPVEHCFQLHAFDHGWICKLPGMDESTDIFPPDLVAVFAYARSMGLNDYDLICFDTDGGQVPNLAMYATE